MATTIKSTELDFFTIKNNLKTFLAAKDEFSDYNFEASGLSNILDVLAYNTHYNALIANFALNESYLNTAQLRNSVVSLSESIGYVPGSKKSSEAAITFTINLTATTGRLPSYTLQPGELVLVGSVDGIDYTFTNRESLTAFDVNGIYEFKPTASQDSVTKVYEGQEINKQFLVGTATDPIYVITDEEIDISTAIVSAYPDQLSASDATYVPNYYINLIEATEIKNDSRLYVLRESPNKYFELTFGNGTSLGLAPSPGNVVNVNYLRNSGSDANGILVFELSADLTLTGVGTIAANDSRVSVVVDSSSAGGTDKESIESIRKNAPFQYASQNRMVTANDYSSLILRKYSTFIEDIKSWGGEDDPKPDFGSVFTSIVYKDNLSSSTIANVRTGIVDLANQFSIASFDLKFKDPDITYVSTNVRYQFNPLLTSLSESSVNSRVASSVSNYFEQNTGKFDQVFRRSNMLTDVDAIDAGVLSSLANIVMNKRIKPTLTLSTNYSVTFPVSIRAGNSVKDFSVYSNYFTFNNQTCRIENKYSSANPNGLRLISTAGTVLKDNVGNYNPVLGTVSIEGLIVQSLTGGVNYFKLYAVPNDESAINIEFNSILKFNSEDSTYRAIKVTSA